MSDQFLGEIRMFGCNFAPRGWAMCNGQILSISQYAALFSIIGTYYGGNGTSNFALPDLRGRAALNTGQGPGLSDYLLGETAGVQTVALNLGEMAQHSHTFSVDPAAKKESNAIGGNVPAGASGANFYSTAVSNVNMNAQMLSSVGGSQAHDNMQPYLVVNFCIALVGIFPERG